MSEIELPAPTAWPIVLAMAVALAAAGLVTDVWVTMLGAILFLAAAVGWFREVLPVDRVEHVTTDGRLDPVIEARPAETHPLPREHDHRAQLPVQTYSVSAGIKGGIAGGAAMAALAVLYGVISHHGIWYPINLLAACVVRSGPQTTAALSSFHASWLLVALALHAVASLLVGVLYGTTLPMIPRSPILLGGVLVPLCWTGLLHPSLGIINPVLDARIDWWWFTASQVAFGVVAGVVVRSSERIFTAQPEPRA